MICYECARDNHAGCNRATCTCPKPHPVFRPEEEEEQ